MKKGLLVLMTLAAAVALSGCGGGVLGKVQEFGGGLAERQCSKTDERRQVERLVSFAALDGKASVKVCCPGSECYARSKEAARAAVQVFNDLQSGDYAAASGRILEAAAKVGIQPGAAVDASGCFNKDGWRVCPPRAPPQRE